MQPTPWIERTFNFDFPEGLLPSILERLRGTELRMIAMTTTITDEVATAKPQNKWSIKEEIGHLADLEDLHISRLEEMIARKTKLSAADMSNQKTEEANHNQVPVGELISTFAQKRNQFISLLESMDEETHFFRAKHPRLEMTMRPVDVAFFTSEHDDHHLAHIRRLLSH